MKLFTFILSLALAVLATADVLSADWKNAGFCARKGVDVNCAITAFCNKQDMVVPSNYASGGATCGPYHIKVTGDCNPAAWVPSWYCRAQFHSICAQSGHPKGAGVRHYGLGDCQRWEIHHK
jgi:hypothetical protein